MSTHQLLGRVVLCILLTTLVPRARAAFFLQTENFDVNPVTSSNEWRLQNGNTGANNFGYKTTSNAGGAAGEAGGDFQRPGNLGYFADLTIGAPHTNFTVFTSLQSSGRIFLDRGGNTGTDDIIRLGYFNQFNTNLGATTGPHAPDNYVGFSFSPNGSVAANAFGGDYGGYNGSGGNAGSSMSALFADGQYVFGFSYVAGGFTLGPGQFNYGEITLTMSNVSSGVTTTLRNALNPIQNRTNKILNAFGLFHANTTSDSNPLLHAAYIDDLSYTSSIPEPSSLICLGLGGLLLGIQRRRHSSKLGA